MCHFPTFAAHAPMDSGRADPDCSGPGFPIRRSRDQPVCGSPGLFAAYHVLPRLSAPRHPPCTLSSLTALIPLPELHSSVSVRMPVASQRPGAQSSRMAPQAVLENTASATNCCAVPATVIPAFLNTHSSIFKERTAISSVVLVAGVGFEPTTSGL